MSKKLLTSLMVGLLILVSINSWAGRPYKNFWFQVQDEFEVARTDFTSVTVYDLDTTNAATVYASEQGGSKTNPILLAATTDGVAFWYGDASTYDVLVTFSDQTVLFEDFSVYDHRMMCLDTALMTSLDDFTFTGHIYMTAGQHIYFRGAGDDYQSMWSISGGKLKIQTSGTGADDLIIDGTISAMDNITMTAGKYVYLRGTTEYIYSISTGKIKLMASGIGADDFIIGCTTEMADDLTLKSGALLIGDDATDATGTTDGAFQTDGGMGIAKKLFVGTNLDVAGTSALDGEVTFADTVYFNSGSYDSYHGMLYMDWDVTPTTYGIHLRCPASTAMIYINPRGAVEVDYGVLVNIGDLTTFAAGLYVLNYKADTPVGMKIAMAGSGKITDAILLENKVTTDGIVNGIRFSAYSTGNIKYAFSFKGVTGISGAKVGAACDTNTGTSNAAIKIDIDGTTYFIPAFTAGNTTGSW